MIFTHGIDSILRAIHNWTKENLPSVVMTKHDFKDGKGSVPAIPFNKTAISIKIENVRKIDSPSVVETMGLSIPLTRIREIDSPSVVETMGLSIPIIGAREVDSPSVTKQMGISIPIINIEEVS